MKECPTGIFAYMHLRICIVGGRVYNNKTKRDHCTILSRFAQASMHARCDCIERVRECSLISSEDSYLSFSLTNNMHHRYSILWLHLWLFSIHFVEQLLFYNVLFFFFSPNDETLIERTRETAGEDWQSSVVSGIELCIYIYAIFTPLKYNHIYTHMHIHTQRTTTKHLMCS